MQEVGLNKISLIQMQLDYTIVEVAEGWIQWLGDAYHSYVPNHCSHSIIYG